jgi:hypothetical protein
MPGGITSAAERALLRRVFERCHVHIVLAVNGTLLPAEFLGALTANESGGNVQATRFEPSVYQHLKDVAEGRMAAFGAIDRDMLTKVAEAMVPPTSAEGQPRHPVDPTTAAAFQAAVAPAEAAMRQLATSWGFTQIMGYHLVPHGQVHELLDAELHYRHAVGLLEKFASRYKLDMSREFGELFCCWNTGRPYGKTFDPGYIPRGLRRMEIYREVVEEARRAELELEPDSRSQI